MDTSIDDTRGPFANPFRTLGPLRAVLIVLAVLAIAGAPFAGGEVSYEFPTVIPTLIAPPFAVMMGFTIPLDILMTALFISERTGAERKRLKTILAIEIVLLGVLVAAWFPFFSQLATR